MSLERTDDNDGGFMSRVDYDEDLIERRERTIGG
jgi:hypothetical protein